MLKLTLDQGDYVMIGDDIKVSFITKRGGKQLVLGFDAPKDVKIMRERVHEELLLQEAGEDTKQAQQLVAQLQAAREERERATAFSEEKIREKNRKKMQRRKAAREIKVV